MSFWDDKKHTFFIFIFFWYILHSKASLGLSLGYDKNIRERKIKAAVKKVNEDILRELTCKQSMGFSLNSRHVCSCRVINWRDVFLSVVRGLAGFRETRRGMKGDWMQC